MFALVRDKGCEGYSPPIQLFYTLSEAKSALALTESCKVFRVPIWPEAAYGEWYNLEPVK